MESTTGQIEKVPVVGNWYSPHNNGLNKFIAFKFLRQEDEFYVFQGMGFVPPSFFKDWVEVPEPTEIFNVLNEGIWNFQIVGKTPSCILMHPDLLHYFRAVANFGFENSESPKAYQGIPVFRSVDVPISEPKIF